jgi:hypothetical protein
MGFSFLFNKGGVKYGRDYILGMYSKYFYMISENFKIDIGHLYGLNEVIDLYSTPIGHKTISEPVTLIIEKRSNRFDPDLLRKKVEGVLDKINNNILINSKIKKEYESNPLMVDSPHLMEKYWDNYIMTSAKKGGESLLSAIDRYINQSKNFGS